MTIKEFLVKEHITAHEERLKKLKELGAPKVIIAREKEIIAELKAGDVSCIPELNGEYTFGDLSLFDREMTGVDDYVSSDEGYTNRVFFSGEGMVYLDYRMRGFVSSPTAEDLRRSGADIS